MNKAWLASFRLTLFGLFLCAIISAACSQNKRTFTKGEILNDVLVIWSGASTCIDGVTEVYVKIDNREDETIQVFGIRGSVTLYDIEGHMIFAVEDETFQTTQVIGFEGNRIKMPDPRCRGIYTKVKLIDADWQYR